MPTAIADGRQQHKLKEEVEIVGDKVEKGQDSASTSADESEQPAERQRRVLAAAPIAETRRTSRGGGGGTRINCDNETKKREGDPNGASIDSRSILNNKQRLKRFWERRMELDSKRVQSGQEINCENNKMTPRHRPAAMVKRQHTSQDSIKLASGKQTEFSLQRDDCDSPPPPLGQDENNNDSGELGGHVSAELLCEKLLAYEQTQRRATHKGPEVPNGQQTRPATAVEDNSQPMSIDPTLCHVNTARTTTTTMASDQDELDEEQDEEQVANEEFGSSNSSIVGPSQSSNSGAQANDNQAMASAAQAPKRSRSASLDSGDSQEETSTQSGSVLTVISGNNNNNNTEKKLAAGENNGTELTGGRATPTLITSLEDEQEVNQLVGDFGEDQSASLAGAESDGSNIGVAFESLHFDDEIKSSRSEQVDEERLLAGLGTKKPVLPVPVVNSLVAKTRATIKLANEDIAQHNNDELEQQRRGDKFSSREVRSVCALITSAISDAGRQVEGYLRQSSLVANAQANLKVNATSDVADDDDESPITPLTNHDGRESSDEEVGGGGGGFQRATFVARNESHRPTNQPTNQRQRAEQVATIGYLADEDDDEDDEGDDGEEDSGDDQERQLSSPRADLSSIFEANVRREIERFESNTMLRRQQSQPGGCGQKSAGLTEWRIAEEIRLFNEREKELKQRCKSTNAHKVHQQQGATMVPPGGADAKCQQQEQQLESIVRFGKTLQIPKPASDAHQSATTSRYIKLTTKGAAPSQPATTISMHKFISSGGKRFVCQTAQVNASSSSQLHGLSSRVTTTTTANHSTMDNHLTKSMSNLSTCATSSTGRQVDYRAVDSLKCKEVPNVAPGFAKKTIETFARLNSETSLNKLGRSQDLSDGVGGSMASIGLNNDHSARTKSGACTNSSGNLNNGHTTPARPYLQHNHQQPMMHGAAGLPTAERKIQEELREMKAREAELRSLRNQHRQQQQQQQQPPPSASKPKQHNSIVANVKPVHRQQQQQRPAATEHVNGIAGKQRLLTRPNRFHRQNHDADEASAPSIHSAHLMANGDTDNRDNHDDLESASGDDESDAGSDNESGCERIRPVNARGGGGGVGGCGTHAYQHKSTSQLNGSGNSTLVSGSCGADDLAGGSDSLYPIKQTIDSFRKLNQQSAAGGESSGDCNNNSGGGGQVSMTSAHRSASSGFATDRVRVNKK